MLRNFSIGTFVIVVLSLQQQQQRGKLDQELAASATAAAAVQHVWQPFRRQQAVATSLARRVSQIFTCHTGQQLQSQQLLVLTRRLTSCKLIKQTEKELKTEQETETESDLPRPGPLH